MPQSLTTITKCHTTNVLLALETSKL